ncbi:thymidine phosphorylase [Candidatus Avelusimicrobium alvi]|uniref:thymidine phosphorylase n=1 Tax=Candidatus Avelusimicrobium alvi TaxID=3416221 RepID=UPI003D0F148D
MRMIDVIIKKRNGKPLTQDEFNFVAQGAAKGTVPDYQLSAFLMACFLNPLSDKETALFTKAMAHSGGRLDFSSVKIPTVDKHSTGGVGDGISMALAPLVACAGVAVPMMSGRGLGHTGGTLDKLESMKNFEVRVPVKLIYRQIQKLGVCMFGQTQDLAPADKKLYSLRDATGTVESRPLIVASILSKKYAEGVDSLLMDVKYGSGAFMQKLEDSRKLARALVNTAKLLGLNCRALITYMDQPLGRAIGNANEMLQTVLILKGDKTIAPDFYELLIEEAASMLFISGKVKDMKKARALMEEKIANGEAVAKLREMIKWQGASPEAVDNPVKYFKNAKLTFEFKADASGYVQHIDAKTAGMAGVLLGAGRNTMEDVIDYGAGIWLNKKAGEAVKKGDVIATLYASDKKRLTDGAALFKQAVKIGKKKPAPYKIVKEVIK